DSAFSQAVRKARRATGDDGRTQGVIRTISRHGYRFVARVRPAADEASPAPPAESPRRASRRAAGRWTIVAAVGILLALAAGMHRSPTGPAPRHAVLPVALEPEAGAASSPGDTAWVELGLMALIDTALQRAALDTIAPSAVLATLE